MAIPRRVDLYDAAQKGDVATFESFFAQQATLEAALAVDQGITDDAVSRLLDSRGETTLALSGTWTYPYGGSAPHIFQVAVLNDQYELLLWFFTSPISAVLRRTLQFFLLDIAKDAVRRDLLVLELLLASDAWAQYPECARSACLCALVQAGVETRQPLVLNLLAAHGADFDRLLDCYDSLNYVVNGGPAYAIVDVLRDHGAFRIGDDRALHDAAMNVYGGPIMALLDLGVDPRSAKGGPLLHRAAGRGDHATVATLLANVCVDLDAQRTTGSTALHDAIANIRIATQKIKYEYGDTTFESHERETSLKVVELLLQHGADPNLCSSEELDCAPLHLAVEMECVETVRTLLKWGADPNVRSTSEQQQTPLHFVDEDFIHVSWDRLEILGELVEHGGDLTLKDANGVVPLQLSQSSPPEIVRIVVQSALHTRNAATGSDFTWPK